MVISSPWTVSSDEWYYNDTIDLRADLTIDGATLYLVNTTLLVNCSSDGHRSITINNGGELNVATYGGIITKASHVVGYQGNTPDISINDGSLISDHGDIESNVFEFYYGTLAVNDADITAESSFTAAHAASIDLSDCNIDVNGPMDLLNCSGTDIDRCDITPTGGIEMTDCGASSITNTDISQFLDHGLYSPWGVDDLYLYYTTFTGPSTYDCIQIKNSDRLVFDQVTIDGGRNGTRFLNVQDAMISNIDITNSRTGMVLSASDDNFFDTITIANCMFWGIESQYCHRTNYTDITISSTAQGIWTSSDRYMVFDDIVVSGATLDGFKANLIRDSVLKESTLTGNIGLDLYYGDDLDLINVTTQGSTGIYAVGTSDLYAKNLDLSSTTGYSCQLESLVGAYFDGVETGGATVDVKMDSANLTVVDAYSQAGTYKVEVDSGSRYRHISGHPITTRTIFDTASVIEEGWQVTVNDISYVGSQATAGTELIVMDSLGKTQMTIPVPDVPYKVDCVTTSHILNGTKMKEFDHNPVHVIAYQPTESRYDVASFDLEADNSTSLSLDGRDTIASSLQTEPIVPIEDVEGVIDAIILNAGTLDMGEIEVKVTSGVKELHQQDVGSLAAGENVSIKLNHLFKTGVEQVRVHWTYDDPVRGEYSITGSKAFDIFSNDKPLAKLDVDTILTNTYELITFSAARSTDNQTVESYWFDFGDGVNSSWVTSPYIAHQYELSGEYYAKVKARDDSGVESDWSTSILIEIVNSAPTSNFIVSAVQGYYNTVFYFNDTSTDVDGNVWSWKWEFGDGSVSSLQHPNYTYPDDGVYTVKFSCIDNEGGTSAVIEKTITILNTGPNAVFTVSNQTPEALWNVTFDGRASDDPDDTIDELSLHWDLGDGNESDRWRFIHAYNQSGNYTVTLTVVDDDDAVSIFTMWINVSEPPPPPPVNNTNNTNITPTPPPPPAETDKRPLYGSIAAGIILALLLIVLFVVLVVKHNMNMKARKKALEEARWIQEHQLLQMSKKGKPIGPAPKQTSGPPQPRFTYYDVLGVSEYSSESDIKKAYRKKMKEYHPDKFQHASDEEQAVAKTQVKMINKAKGWLLDVDKRREYDEFIGIQSFWDKEQDDDDDGFFDDVEDDFDAFSHHKEEEEEEHMTGSIMPMYASEAADSDQIYEQTGDDSEMHEAYVVGETEPVDYPPPPPEDSEIASVLDEVDELEDISFDEDLD